MRLPLSLCCSCRCDRAEQEKWKGVFRMRKNRLKALRAQVYKPQEKSCVLQIENLNISFRMYEEDAPFFRAKQREAAVVNNLNLSVYEGEVLAIVGASGSGKTLLADVIMGLFEPNSLVHGCIYFEGNKMDSASLASIRGRGISLVPQSVSYLDPLMRVGQQVEGDFSTRQERINHRKQRKQLFARYGLSEEVANWYPHQLSGGMARRILLCCALMDNPRVIVADEPTPGLDRNLAQQALNDLRKFADEGGGVVLTTHDIELVLHVADRVAVFKDGTVVEETSVSNFASPDLLAHAFSRELWYALPSNGFSAVETCEDALSKDLRSS